MKSEGQAPRQCDKFYRASMEVLGKAQVPFLVGGAYAFGVYTGITRETKDFDLFLQPHHVDLAIEAFARAGYEAERTFPHWLAKAKCDEDCIDLIYRSGNGLCEVDDSWFARARDEEMLGLRVKLCAPEEILWMKAFIMERERFDGADIAHIFERSAETLDWPHLLHRFGPDWRVLLSHLILFGYIYPGERDRVPAAVLNELMERLRHEPVNQSERLCRGTLLSRQQYLRDVQEGGYRDARLEPRARMNGEDIVRWTDAIEQDGASK